MRDPQAEQLYAMENRFFRAAQRSDATRALLKRIAERAAKRWHLTPPTVKFSTHTKLVGQSHSLDRVVTLFARNPRRPWGGRNVPVLLHEVAHYITDWKHPEEHSHGPNFAAVIRDLYDHYDVLPAECFDCLAKVYGVSVNDNIRAPARSRKR